jgi:replicative DNA helicase
LAITLNIESIKYLYRLLNHGDAFSRVHCQNPNVKGPAGALCSTLVKGEDAVVAWAKQWNTKGQCYISRNPMLAWNKPGKFTAITFDVDPVYDKTKGAGVHQVSGAIRAGERILQKYPGGYLASTGNGILLVYTVPSEITTKLNGTFAPAYKALNEEIKEQFEVFGESSVDILADDMRLVRLIGTMNVKGDPENHRLSKFLRLPKAGQNIGLQILTRLKQLAVTPATKVQIPQTYEPWVIDALEDLGEPNERHQNIIKLAGYFGGKHIPIQLALKLIQESNSRTKDTPYSDNDVEEKVKDIYSRIKRGNYDAEEEASIAVQEQSFELGTIGDNPEAYLQDLAERAKFKTPEIPWPFESLNHMTWGLPRGALTVLGAWTGKGKTSLAITVAEHLNRLDKKVLYFPTEMSRKEIKDRYISVATGVQNLHLFNGQLEEREKALVTGFLPEFQKRKFYLPMTDAPRLNPTELRKALDKSEPDFLVVDFLQRLSSRSDNRRREVAEFIMAVKDEVAKRKIGCLVLSQFHRPQKSQNGKYFPPTIFDFAECGDIENTSDVAIILHPPTDEKGFIVEAQDGERNKPVLCNVAKNRHGGTTGTTYLRVDVLTTKVSQV